MASKMVEGPIGLGRIVSSPGWHCVFLESNNESTIHWMQRVYNQRLGHVV